MLWVTNAFESKWWESPRPDVNLGCCYMVCAVTYCKHIKKSQVSLSCLQAGLWLLSPWKACGGCSRGDTTITKSVHVQFTAFSHPRLLVQIQPSLEGTATPEVSPFSPFYLQSRCWCEFYFQWFSGWIGDCGCAVFWTTEALQDAGK